MLLQIFPDQYRLFFRFVSTLLRSVKTEVHSQSEPALRMLCRQVPKEDLLWAERSADKYRFQVQYAAAVPASFGERG